MHIVFLNPQGNFDPSDSYLTEHPDFGGQLVYVKELAQAVSQQGHKVDIVTRRIRDNAWPEFFKDQESYPGFGQNLRILRFPFGGDAFLKKEDLWPHIQELVEKVVLFYRGALPDFITAHYADGGYAAALTLKKTGIPFSFTGHSLGAQKLDKMETSAENWLTLEKRFKFSKRLAAERISMKYSAKVIVSTEQERTDQYTHPLYGNTIDKFNKEKFQLVPPGVNEKIFTERPHKIDYEIKVKLDSEFGSSPKPVVLVSSRLDEKKNIIGVIKAYIENRALIDLAPLVLCLRGINIPEKDIFKFSEEEQKVMRDILDAIEAGKIRKHIHFLNISSQLELASTYRYFAKRGSVFALTSLYEPFGLAPIEAAATGLVPVVTKNGGPSEIFLNGSGVLVDPKCSRSIARGLLEGLQNHSQISKKALRLVHDKYTWSGTARSYISTIKEVLGNGKKYAIEEPLRLDYHEQILRYLQNG